MRCLRRAEPETADPVTGWRDLGNGYAEIVVPDPDDGGDITVRSRIYPAEWSYTIEGEAAEVLRRMLDEFTKGAEAALAAARASLVSFRPVGVVSTVDAPPWKRPGWRGQRADRVWVDEAHSLAPLGVGPDLDVTRWRCLGGEWVPG